MHNRDFVTHRALTRLQGKFEALDLAQAEAKAALDRARLEREGQWPRMGDGDAHAMTP